MTIVLVIALVWLAALAALTLRLAIRPQRQSERLRRQSERLQRSPSLFAGPRARISDGSGAFEVTMRVLVSKSATAKDVRDRAQQDLYVGP
jgi:hypothetical protein